jgi:hypothetical protein
MFLGIVGIIIAVLYWKSLQFGELNPSISMRIAIPGTLLITLGLQVNFSSFLISLLRMKKIKK